MNKEGAIAGMLAGIIFTVGYILYFKGIFITPLAENKPENWLFGISPEGIGTVGMLVNFVVAFAVSKVTERSTTRSTRYCRTNPLSKRCR